MAYHIRFGPGAQTPAQRALVLAKKHKALPSPKAKAPAATQQLHACHVAGELS